MSTQPLNIISRYGEDDISLWTVNVEFEDYKRVAGNAVQLKVELSRYLHRGSPPHTRGKVIMGFFQALRGGITPAHAGKSGKIEFATGMEEDHPRTRGEKFSMCFSSFLTKGSPPHTRGKVGLYPHLYRESGITPAHAGKSVPDTDPKKWDKDHPRTRGEKFQELHAILIKRGSPPHTRGKDTLFPVSCRIRRITPAHAGKSYLSVFTKARGWDHPRTRGEK